MSYRVYNFFTKPPSKIPQLLNGENSIHTRKEFFYFNLYPIYYKFGDFISFTQ